LKREKAVLCVLRELELDEKGQVIAQREKQRIAEELHKDVNTAHGYLQHYFLGDFLMLMV